MDGINPNTLEIDVYGIIDYKLKELNRIGKCFAGQRIQITFVIRICILNKNIIIIILFTYKINNF